MLPVTVIHWFHRLALPTIPISPSISPCVTQLLKPVLEFTAPESPLELRDPPDCAPDINCHFSWTYSARLQLQLAHIIGKASVRTFPNPDPTRVWLCGRSVALHTRTLIWWPSSVWVRAQISHVSQQCLTPYKDRIKSSISMAAAVFSIAVMVEGDPLYR